MKNKEWGQKKKKTYGTISVIFWCAVQNSSLLRCAVAAQFCDSSGTLFVLRQSQGLKLEHLWRKLQEKSIINDNQYPMINDNI